LLIGLKDSSPSLALLFQEYLHDHQEFSNLKIIFRIDSRTWLTMGVIRTVLEHGNGDQPKKGDEITVEYAGFLYDEVMHCRGQ